MKIILYGMHFSYIIRKAGCNVSMDLTCMKILNMYENFKLINMYENTELLEIIRNLTFCFKMDRKIPLHGKT